MIYLQAPPLFKGFVLDLMPPCGLHLILAIHRYMWKFMYNVINKRSQDNFIAEALRTIQLDYLAYQIESYIKRLNIEIISILLCYGLFVSMPAYITYSLLYIVFIFDSIFQTNCLISVFLKEIYLEVVSFSTLTWKTFSI